MPFALVPFLLLIVPVVEIAAFIAVGGQIGTFYTLMMILVTAIIGTMLLRWQGFQILNSIKAETAQGKIPGRTLGDGAMILVAGILLLTPGFVTDAIGFSLFVPFVRSIIWSFMASRVSVFVPGSQGEKGGFGQQSDPFNQNPYRDYHDDTVIDLDADEYSSSEKNPDSPWSKDDR